MDFRQYHLFVLMASSPKQFAELIRCEESVRTINQPDAKLTARTPLALATSSELCAPTPRSTRSKSSPAVCHPRSIVKRLTLRHKRSVR